jgi:hypothetical protein
MVVTAAPPVGENGTGESDKSKLAKRVKLARSTDLWCLSPFTPVTQEAMDKPRKVCPVNLRGRSARPPTAGVTFDLPGVMFDRNFSMKLYLHSLSRESSFRAGRVARLAQHLPRGQLLRQRGSGLFMGKIALCLPVVVRPRLPGSTAATPESLSQVQVDVNDVARSVVGCRREDHIAIVDML